MPSVLKDYSFPIALGGGVTSALIAGAALHRAGKEAIGDVPEYGKRKPGAFAKAKKEFGVNVGYQDEPAMKDNALFAPKEILTEATADSPDNLKLKILMRKAKEQGLVVTGEGYKRPGIVEHELGHAIAKSKGTPWEKFTHSRVAPVLSTLSSLTGGILGYGVGVKHGPLAGALTGLGISGLGNLPTIHGEMIANRYASELMPEKKERVSTWPFVGSYINAGVTTPTVAGALAGLIGRK